MVPNTIRKNPATAKAGVIFGSRGSSLFSSSLEDVEVPLELDVEAVDGAVSVEEWCTVEAPEEGLIIDVCIDTVECVPAAFALLLSESRGDAELGRLVVRVGGLVSVVSCRLCSSNPPTLTRHKGNTLLNSTEAIARDSLILTGVAEEERRDLSRDTQCPPAEGLSAH